VRRLAALLALVPLLSCAKTSRPTVIEPASGIELILIPAPRPFYIGATEVTTGQFRRFVEATGYVTDAERGTPEGNGKGRGSFTAMREGERDWSAAADWRHVFEFFPEFRVTDEHPVMHVSWNDAGAFASHYGMRLPTASEWELAARAGRTTRYPWGDDAAGGAPFANVRDATAAAVFGQPEVVFPFDDHALLPMPVRSYRPNDWGLYDAIGNLAEWVEDSQSGGRVLKGGSWVDYPDGATLAASAAMDPAARRDFIGFRVAMPYNRDRKTSR
jgi:sulfatase modifying factor 1